MGYCICRGSTGLCFGSIALSGYINDIVDNVHCDIKRFADDASIFSVFRNDRSSKELNRDLERLRLWSFHFFI